MVEFTLRVDDIFNRGSPVRPRSLSPLLELAEQYQSRVILNVIPRRLIESTNQNGAMVRELLVAIERGHEVIQHGYDHCCSQCGETGHQTYCTRFNREQPVEFERQELKRGKEMLEAAIGQRVFVYGPTGTDLHTTQLLSVVKELGFLATTGIPTDEHARIGLPVVPTGCDYAFAARTDQDFEEALAILKAEFDQISLNAQNTGKTGYFQILLHDPFIRSGYENGATLQYVKDILNHMTMQNDVTVKNILSRDVLGLTGKDLSL
jgi:peptidoglycan/xylan/chitin deacetylase (PgdA/CDA1 family)